MTLVEDKHPSTRTINSLRRPTRRMVGATLAVALDVWSPLPWPCGCWTCDHPALNLRSPGPCGHLALNLRSLDLQSPCPWTCGRPELMVALAPALLYCSFQEYKNVATS